MKPDPTPVSREEIESALTRIEDGNVTAPQSAQPVVIGFDPAVPEAVIKSDPGVPIRVITSTAGWTVQRVYSQYTSREVFTDPDGVEWVRVSSTAYDPERGDIEVELKTRGLSRMLLRRRDALAANLKKED